jgi:hypothetical protein
MSALKLYGLAVVSIILLFALTIQYLPDVVKSLGSDKWVEVPGKIVESREVKGIRRRSGSMPLVRYSYSHLDTRYEGKRIRFGGTSPRQTAALFLEYPVGKKVSVLFRSNRPIRINRSTGLCHRRSLGPSACGFSRC